MENSDQNAADQEASARDALNLFGGNSGQLTGNLFPLFSQMRSMAPVVRVPFPVGGMDVQAWMVVRMDEVMQVLRDHARFTVEPRAIDSGALSQASFTEHLDPTLDSSGPATFFTGKSMLFVDEPDHRRLRGLVSKAFTPRYIESLRPRVQEIADTLLDRVAPRGEMDLVADYAYPLPINVISEMLGVPEGDRAQIQVWSAALARGVGVARPEPGVAAHMRAFGQYAARMVAEKRQHPESDLVSQLIALEEGGDRLSEAELVSMITLLIFAGHETTSNLIAIGTLMLIDHPEQLERLKGDPSQVPSAVEELLRFNGPATIVGPRFATEDVDLGGQQISKGDMVIPVVKSANRDERQFAEADRLDVTRTIKRHVAFGYGIHMCLGAPLARMEGDIAFTTLLTRMPNLGLGAPRDQLAWHSSLISQGLDSLPIVFSGPAGSACLR
jgi:cytochrome P450